MTYKYLVTIRVTDPGAMKADKEAQNQEIRQALLDTAQDFDIDAEVKAT